MTGAQDREYLFGCVSMTYRAHFLARHLGFPTQGGMQGQWRFPSHLQNK